MSPLRFTLALALLVAALAPARDATAQAMACCHYAGDTPTCSDMDLTELDSCISTDGDPFPLRECASLDCPDPRSDKFGCCLPSGDACVDVIGIDACYETLSGTPFGADTCADIDCGLLPRQGICCAPDEQCTETLDILCDDTFIEGNTCGPDACAAIRGACCTEMGCERLSEELCGDAGGTFHGVGEICDPLLCARGCCLPGGACSIEPDLMCDLRVGTSVEALTCEPTTCDEVATACCLPGDGDTGCLELDPQSCTDAGGASYANLLCDELTCPDFGPETTACCTLGVCEDVTAASCLEGGGQLINGLACSGLGACPPPELGACCVDTPFPICSDRASEASCTSRGGAWYRETPCAELDASTCNVVSGACCNAGVCTETFEPAVCEAGGGRFLAGASCDDIDCSQGACCLGEFGCASGLYRDQCDGFAGSFFEAQRCRDIECESACCEPDGRCTNVLADQCEVREGFSVGRGVLCDYVAECPAPDPDTAACCEGPLCSDVEPAACDGRVYYGLDCDDFAGGQCPYTERGACCLDQEVCADLSVQTSCDAIGGNFYPGIDCEAANATVCHPQPFWACCVDGVCEESTDRYCSSRRGESFDGQSCDEVVCPMPADPDPDAGDVSVDTGDDTSTTTDTGTDPTDDPTTDPAADPVDDAEDDASHDADETDSEEPDAPDDDATTASAPGPYHGGALFGCTTVPTPRVPGAAMLAGLWLWMRRKRREP